jgi:Ca2+-binding RTX toxin-like protein
LLVTIIDTNETLTIKGFVASTYGNIDRLLFADGTMWNQTAMQGNVTVIGTEGDDYLSTRPFSGGKAYGLGGNDTLVGHWGGHLLSGGAGNDSLTVGGGNNVLDGGTETTRCRVLMEVMFSTGVPATITSTAAPQ